VPFPLLDSLMHSGRSPLTFFSHDFEIYFGKQMSGVGELLGLGGLTRFFPNRENEAGATGFGHPFS
jgi:hypothetical protein